MTATVDLIENLPFALGDAAGARARVGVVTLASDYTIEHEFRRVFTLPGVDFYVARIANSPVISPESLAAMAPMITATADLILPGDTLDVVAYACTSASMVLGEERVADLLRAARPEAKTTNPIAAAQAAFHALGARRVAVLTPYSRAVNEIVLAYLRARGVEIPVFGSFNEPDDRNVARIGPDSLRAAVLRLIEGREVDAVFISCTTVRALAAIPALETETGLPVVSANQALAWHCLRLAGVEEPPPGLGRLFTH